MFVVLPATPTGLDLLLCSECIFAGWADGDGAQEPLLATVEELMNPNQTTLLLVFEERGGLGGSLIKEQSSTFSALISLSSIICVIYSIFLGNANAEFRDARCN
jgi:hypothetical protein